MNKANKYICIHGHFYQPPRENAWLEYVELQDSARPFHDWNERINYECYAPNTAARILGSESFIKKIVNNYRRISFNFGPTLLNWMKKGDPETYQSILYADQKSIEKHNGHGNAIAQVHSHLILPLANLRDKHTQVIWGIRDFEYQFNRKPEGMWLAETAANTESLEVLAEHGIKYTILAPRQAKAFREIGTEDWTNTDSIDPRRPYLCNLPSGKSIVLFFYDGDKSQGVAFNGYLNNGKRFAEKLMEGFDDNDEPQLVHIATDGESYGHHHKHGEMALASCLNDIEENSYAVITNYGEYLEKFPPVYEAQIHENSSWSCVHGVERWRSNCGCNTGGPNSGSQAWRKPLRDALDWVRDKLIPVYEKEAAKLLKDPWNARNEYIDVLLDRTDYRVNQFINANAKGKLNDAKKTQMIRLLEMQRNAILMYTSCGWFFDEISGLETNQILQYALRAISYAKQVANIALHDGFVKRLAKAPSNIYEHGAVSYQLHVVPSRVDLVRAGMHYAVASLFEENPERLELFNYTASSEMFDRIKAGSQRLVVGRTIMKSKITYSEKHFSFAVLYLGQQNIIGNISVDMKKETFDEMHDKMIAAFRSTNLGDVIAIMQEYFGKQKYTIWHLFRDEKHKILKEITKKSLQQAESTFNDIYNDNYQLMTGIKQSGIPVPDTFLGVVKHKIKTDLQNFFEKDHLNLKELVRYSSELQKWGVHLNGKTKFGYAAGQRIYAELKKLNNSDITLPQLEKVNETFKILTGMGISPDIWKAQNLYFSMMKGYKRGEWVFASEEWKSAVQKLGEALKVRV